MFIAPSVKQLSSLPRQSAGMKWLLGILILCLLSGARCGCPFARSRVEYAWAHEAEPAKGEGAEIYEP